MPQAASDRKARTSGTNLGVFDRRRRVPSPKRAPLAELQRVLTLYGDHYPDFDIRHFHQLAWRQHHVRFCYAFVDLRRRRATKRILHAELWEGGESIAAIMSRTLQDRLVNECADCGHCNRRGGQSLPARTLPARLQCRARARAGRSRLGLRPGARRRARAHSLHRRRARRRPRQCRHDRAGRAPARQAAGPPHLCRAACWCGAT
jgi:hypothetical protein